MGSDVVLSGEVVGGGELTLTRLDADTLDLFKQWLIAHAKAPVDLDGNLIPPGQTQNNTYKLYWRVGRDWLTHCVLKGIDPINPGKATVDAWQTLIANTPTRRGTPPSQSTLATTISVVASFYSFLLDEEEIDASPIRKRGRPQAPKESQTIGMSATEADALETTLALNGSPLERAMLLTLLWQGLRAAELLNMTVDALGHNAGVRTMRVLGKGNKVRTIPVAPIGGAAIDEILKARFGDDEPPPDALLFTVTGTRLTRQSLTRDLQRLARAAGIPSHAKLSLHSLRHTCATLMLDSGAQLHVVQAFLGHSSPETTGRYDRARGALDRAVTALAGMRRHVSAHHPPATIP